MHFIKIFFSSLYSNVVSHTCKSTHIKKAVQRNGTISPLVAMHRLVLLSVRLLLFVITSLDQWPKVLQPSTLVHYTSDGLVCDRSHERGPAVSSLCLKCILICTRSCPPGTGTLRTDDGFNLSKANRTRQFCTFSPPSIVKVSYVIPK